MLTTRRLLLSLLGATALAFASLAAPQSQALSPESRSAKVDAALKTLVEGKSTPGIAVLILMDGKPVYAKSLGVREPGGSEPMRPDDMFRLASMTKAVTSVAAMRLVEEGLISLDDPVSKYLPVFEKLTVRAPDGSEAPAERPPTIRELLTHTAGLSYNFINNPRLAEKYKELRVTDGLDQPEVNTEEAMRRLAAAPLGYQPGKGWEYSLATDVLGAVIEKVTGKQLGDVVAEKVAKPLRLDSFVFTAPESMRARFVTATRPAQPVNALGVGYEPLTKAEAVPFPATKTVAMLDPNRAFVASAYHSGGAGMSGTLGDYARFVQMLANEGELDGVRILKPETVRQMTQNQVGNMPTLRGPGWGFGLGFGVLTDPAAAKVKTPAGSYGWGGIYGTQFWVDPSNKIAGVVMTQTAIIGSGPIANLVREAFYAEE